MNLLKRICISMLFAGLYCSVKTDFFSDGNNSKEIRLFTNQNIHSATIQDIVPNASLIVSDFSANPPETRIALLTQDPVSQQWQVSYCVIENIPGQLFKHKEEAQEFVLLHLRSGGLNISDSAPVQTQKIAKRQHSDRGWRRKHIKTR